MGQFPLRNGVLSMITTFKEKSIGQWGKILVMAMGFVYHLGPGQFLKKDDAWKKVCYKSKDYTPLV